MRAMSSFVVTPGIRAVRVAAWWRRSWGLRPLGASVARSATFHAFDRVARRSGPPPGTDEQGSVGVTGVERGEVLLERGHDDGGEGDDPAAGGGLRWELDPSGPCHLLRLPLDPDLGVEQVHVSETEPEGLPGAEPSEAGEHHERPVATVDCVGQVEDERGRDHRPFLGVLLARTAELARVLADELVGFGGGEHGSEEAVALRCLVGA